MTITIRNFEEADLSFVQERDFLLWLKLMYCGDFKRENAFTAIDMNHEILGVGCLSFHCTWYSMELDILHKLKYSLVLREDYSDILLVKKQLIDRLIEKLGAYQKSYPDKKLCISTWCDEDDLDEMQYLLSLGFAMSAAAPVLKYDLTKEIKHYKLPDNIRIREYPMNEQTVDAYISATAAANHGVGDSAAEILFLTGADSFKLFVAEDIGNDSGDKGTSTGDNGANPEDVINFGDKVESSKDTAMDNVNTGLYTGGKIVSSVTLWEINEFRSATENIFTIPEYRRQNIARETIATGLEHLKSIGKQIGTLSVEGANLNAIRLYLSIGYELMYHQVEMRYFI